ncbi:MAG TPA: cupin domain-containing protein [Rhizomicrobium sp.]
MTKTFTNIHEAAFEEGRNARGETWTALDLSGKHLGVRIEDIAPGGTSSVHHYHTLEEEHVLVLDSTATLILGAEEHSLKTGDHVWFEAGKDVAHHIENRSAANFRYLVFGERNDGDVVYYPDNRVMMVKAPDRQLFTYRPFTLPDQPPKTST